MNPIDIIARRLAEATVEILIGALLFLSDWWPMKVLACVALGTGVGAVVLTLVAAHDD
ncbi:hypothetical protein [Lacticaseibacillus pantheris]|uniref:hypothetical protein n=1 Tax=Lacticaseibacillus pantheris TaxID=171523 RepID=UPI000AB8E6E8|nr:hypothetical protein [Lacticaseibacillus pantheris]